MIIDITDLDITQVLQALYAGAGLKGYGLIPYVLDEVEGLSRSEAASILEENKGTIGSSHEYGHDIDYVHGVPVKWDGIEKGGRYLIHTIRL